MLGNVPRVTASITQRRAKLFSSQFDLRTAWGSVRDACLNGRAQPVDLSHRYTGLIAHCLAHAWAVFFVDESLCETKTDREVWLNSTSGQDRGGSANMGRVISGLVIVNHLLRSASPVLPLGSETDRTRSFAVADFQMKRNASVLLLRQPRRNFLDRWSP
jgi:hypothetical protein